MSHVKHFTWLTTLAIGCVSVPTMIAYQPTQVTFKEKPKKVYAAGIRALARKGLGLQPSNPKAGVIETEWLLFQGEGLQPAIYVSYRVFINSGQLEIFSSCKTKWTGDYEHACEGRPPSMIEQERQLAHDILEELRITPNME